MVASRCPQQGGKLVAIPPGAKWDLPTRKLFWSIPQLEPLQSVEMTFVYGTSTPGLYRATAEATAPGELRASDTLTTDVSGIAVLDLQVSQTSRVMDVGKTNFYDIDIKNSGTKEATRLQLRGKLTGKLKVLKHYNVEKGDFTVQPGHRRVHLPRDRAAGRRPDDHPEPGSAGHRERPAGCHVFLAHAEMGDRGRQGRGRHLHHRHRQPLESPRQAVIAGSGAWRVVSKVKRSNPRASYRHTPHSTPH